MTWSSPENIILGVQGIAVIFLIASLVVFVFWVALPVHRLVVKLADYAKARGDVLPGDFKNDSDVLAHVFKLLTQDLQQKENELQALYEKARDRAKFMERYSDRLVESVPAALMGFDAKGLLASLNTTAAAFFRLRWPDAQGQTAGTAFAAFPEVRQWVEEALRSSREFQGTELVWKDPLGEDVTVEVSGAPLPEGEGRPAGYVVIFMDRTPLRRLEAQARANERLESLVDLSTGLAHQLRNPLSGVLGYADLILKKTGDEGEVAEMARAVWEDGLLLKKVVDDFLEFLRERQVAEKPLHWSEVLGEVHRDLERELQKKSVALHVETPSREPAVGLDRLSAYQVVFNLILNALEAAPVGGRVEVRCVENPADSEVVLAVEDSGAGVTSEAEGKVFHPFFTTKPEGRGLGLAVVQRAVKAVKGRVEWGRSPLGGAKFSVFLPTVGPEGPVVDADTVPSKGGN